MKTLFSFKSFCYKILLSAVVMIMLSACAQPLNEWFGFKAPTSNQLCTITYSTNVGECPKSISVNKGTIINQSHLPELEYAGWKFYGWNKDNGIKMEIGFVIEADITLTAQWDLIQYNIDYFLNGGLLSAGSPNSYTVETETIILPEPVKDGYYFIGWYTDSDYTSLKNTIPKGSTGNIVLYAKWEKNSPVMYKINYYSDYGKVPDAVELMDGTILGTDELPVIEETGWKFLGWYSGDQEIIAGHVLVGNLTLRAKWEEIDESEDLLKTTVQIGDIVLSNGKFITSDDFNKYEGTEKAVGIVCNVNDNGESGLMLGLYNSSAGTNSGNVNWAIDGTTGSNTFFSAIQGTKTSGDKNGRDNWAKIRKVDPKGTANPATNYPAFNYVLQYAKTAGLKGTDYAENWYMPSIYELYNYVYMNIDLLNKSLVSTGGTAIASEIYWSSSSDSSYNSKVGVLDLSGHNWSTDQKGNYNYVCCFRTFGEIPDLTKGESQIGDIVLENGRFITADDYNFFAESLIPVGVVCKVNDDKKSGLMVGLQNGSEESPSSGDFVTWATRGTTGCNTNFTAIQGTKNDGDIDGSDNWNEICKVDPEGTANPATNYPAFNYVLQYAKTAGLEGTDYAENWYMPTIYELYNYLESSRDLLNKSIKATDGKTFSNNHLYWSSTQVTESTMVYYSRLLNDIIYEGYKYYTSAVVCCMRAF